MTQAPVRARLEARSREGVRSAVCRESHGSPTYDESVRLRIITALSIAVVAFYLGVAVDADRTPTTFEIPDSLPPITTTHDTLRLRESTVAVVTVQSHTDRLQTFAAIAALVAGPFLLARLAFVARKRLRLRRAA
jgi:hypothetical protein